MIRFLAMATLVTLLPLSSASGATFTFDATATLTLTSVEGGMLSVPGMPGNIAISPFVPTSLGGFESTFGGITTRDGSAIEIASDISGITADISGSGESGPQLSFALSSASLFPGFFIRTNGASDVTANFTFAFDHRISTTATLFSSTSSAISFIGLREFRNGVRTDLVSSQLLLNTGFALSDPASDTAQDSGTFSFSIVVPHGFEWFNGGLQFFVEASGQTQTYAVAPPAPIPLPSSAVMFAAGLGLLTRLRRRRGEVRMVRI